MNTIRHLLKLWSGAALVIAWLGGPALQAQTTQWGTPFDWSAVAEVTPGLQRAEVLFTSPRRMVVNVLRADLSHPDLRLGTTPRSTAWGQTFSSVYTARTDRETCTAFLSRNRAEGRNMVAAINAAPFKPFPTSSPYSDKMGLAVEAGVVVSEQLNSDFTSPSLVYGRDWRARFASNKGDFVDPANVLTAVSGFEMVLSAGVPAGDSSPDPRTGIGLSGDQRWLILITVDGRQTGYSEGAGTRELGELMLYFGARDGMNMDGGGSTTMALYDKESGTVSVANSPSGGGQRSVANHLGIYYISTPEQIGMDDWLAWRGVPLGLRGAHQIPGQPGLPNALAYALNIHPLEGAAPGDNGASPVPAISADGTRLELFYRRNRHATDIDISVEGSAALEQGSWETPPQLSVEEVGTDPVTLDTIYRAGTPLNGDKYFLRLATILNTTPPPVETTGTIGNSTVANSWDADWADNFDTARTTDVLVSPATSHLAVGFGGASFPGQTDLVLEKIYQRSPGDTTTYLAEIAVFAGRWNRGDHVAELSYSTNGIDWTMAATETLNLYDNQGGHHLSATVPMTPDIQMLFVRLVVRDTNDSQADGSRIYSFGTNFSAVEPLGQDFTLSAWNTGWAGAFQSVSVSDVIVSPADTHLAIGFAGDSWPDQSNFVAEKSFVRLPGDTADYSVDIQLRASRWDRGNHEYRIEVAIDGGAWQEVAREILTLYSSEGGHFLQASVPLAADVNNFQVRVTVLDTNDWTADGSRLESLAVTFTRP